MALPAQLELKEIRDHWVQTGQQDYKVLRGQLDHWEALAMTESMV
jgi:hypothetical protein